MENGPSPSASPRTDSVQKCLRRHRKALEEIRASNVEQLSTIDFEEKPRVVVFEEREAIPSARNTLQDIVTWKNPAATAVALVAGSGAFALARNASVTKIVCYGLLSRVCWHVLMTMFSSSSGNGSGRSTRLIGSASLERLQAALSGAVRTLALLHDRYIVTNDPKVSLAVCGGLWGVTIVSAYLDFLQLAYLAFVAAFAVPNVARYLSTGGTAASGLREVKDLLRARVPSTVKNMNTRQRRISGALLGAALWVAADWSNRLVGLLMVLLGLRCTMSQTEVIHLREQVKAAPLTKSVKKSARRVSIYLRGD